MNLMDRVEKLIPASRGAPVAWDEAEELLSAVRFSELRHTPQNPAHHGEGDVLTHTRMVCEALCRTEAFHALPAKPRRALFLAAVLHDLGKGRTTRLENGEWTSPNHSSVGSRMVRTFLWRDCGLCGGEEDLRTRESVCALIRYHMLPLRVIERKDPERILRKVAAVGELAPYFSWELLCMLAEADMRGRVADDTEEGLAAVRLAAMAAEEAGCLRGPYPFADAYTRRAYFSGRNVQPDQKLYDDTRTEVILLSGLPGTGKDTWAALHAAGMPAVSLDGIRRRLKIRPAAGQGEVLRTAREEAREYLRSRRPFVWNATNLTKETRQKLIGFFEQYGARVRVCYLETGWEERKARNAGRPAAVPESAVEDMLSRTVPPSPDEAYSVCWFSV